MNEKQSAPPAQNDVMMRELAHVFDVPLHISIEVARPRVRVRELISLSRDSVIELKKPAGEPFDICINGVPVARGQVIIIEQFSGVRITDVQKTGGLVS
jgi:flagellar motor switch protein FliN/FliY